MLHQPWLTIDSAWWGESFVTELRRISASADRKVRFGSVNTSRPDTGINPSAVEQVDANGAADGAPLNPEDSIPIRDKESDPATAIEAQKDNTGAAEQNPPSHQPVKAATQ